MAIFHHLIVAKLCDLHNVGTIPEKTEMLINLLSSRDQIKLVIVDNNLNERHSFFEEG